MNSDSYEFSKSSTPQSVDSYTPFAEKNFLQIPDINSGVYGATNAQIQFDLTSIYNSRDFINPSDCFITLPITVAAAMSVADGTLAVPLAGHASLVSLKTNFQALIHQAELVLGGKVVHDAQPFMSQVSGFRMLSQMTTSDLQAWGASYGFGNELDSEKAVKWNPVAAVYSPQEGVGLCSNRAFVSAAVTGTDTQSIMGATATTAGGGQNAGCINKSLQRRCTRLVDTGATVDAATSRTNWNRIYGAGNATTGSSIMTAAQLAEEFKPYYTVATNVMYWTDLAILPLKYLFDVMDKLPLTRKLDCILRLYVNSGTIQIAVTQPGLATLQYGAIQSTTFQNTCPITINHLPDTPANGGIPLLVTRITAGVFVKNVQDTNIASGGANAINLKAVGAPTHFMASSRVYYSVVKLPAAKEEEYILANRNKQVVYESYIFNQYNSIGPGTTFSQLVQSGIKNPIGLLLVPLIGPATLNGAGGTLGFEQWTSPYDQCGAGGGYAPISLTNLQVQLGGVNVLQGQNLFYTFENFLEQVGVAEALSGADLGVGGVGLINQSWWETNRAYYVDLSRGRDSDKATMRNLSISFKNNSNVSITLLCYTLYLDRLFIDVETGVVTK